ncbi:MAG: hypothetical protein ACQEQB_04565 [Bacteroidota bacterium]
MKTHFKLLLATGLLFFIFTTSTNAQILQTQEEIIETYGEPFSSGISKQGEKYLFYKTPVTTEASGTYNQGWVLYLKTFSNGSEVCYKFKIVEPTSETIYNINSFNRDLVQTDDMKWKDHARGITYTIKEVKGVSLITAEYDNEVSLAKVYKL